MSQQKETPTKLDNFENARVVKSEEDGGGGLSECEASKKESESTTTRLETTRDKMNVSSTAIVKYSRLEPAGLPYAKVQKDTDLNVAPSNWLRDGRFSDVGNSKSDPIELTSFGMAHSFPETIGDVDVISDAENIKKLLKIPYSKAEVSLAVHRVGRTTLLDDLDIPSLLLYASERDDVQLRWLYEFYCEQLNIPKEKAVGDDMGSKDTSYLKKKKNKNQTKLKDIFSKFLHYSIQDQAGQPVAGQVPLINEGSSGYSTAATPTADTSAAKVGACRQGPGVGARLTRNQVIPVNEQEHVFDTLPEPQQASGFQRNVLWKFEDIHMLIGSNMPIFGGGKYPAVSLRLRECGKPINVLTGLDYWLDNLMCNVPEVAMCYHLDGIVQFYDLYKTDELPDLKGSNFSPKVVKDIAQNMLSFLKSNCTQEGHTYWLFKGSDNDVVKLYDLTSICDQKADDKHQNPFTVPVAMLFYRVAKNMMKQPTLSSTDQGTVRLLLNNCLTLLDESKYREIITSANYLLSDLYSPDDLHTLPALDSRACEEDECSRGKEYDPYDELDRASIQSLGSNKSEDETLKSLEVRKLSTPGMFQDDSRQMAKPLAGNIEERCRTALAHIVKGLMCLKVDPAFTPECQSTSNSPVGSSLTNVPNRSSSNTSSPNSQPVTEESVTPLKTSPKNGSKCSQPNQSNASTQEKTLDSRSGTTSKAVVPTGSREIKLYNKDFTFLRVLVPVQWEVQTMALLLRKASSVYHSFAFASISKGKYGRALRYCKMALKCFGAFKSLEGDNVSTKDSLLSSILCACADAYLMLAKCKENLAVHQEDYGFKSKDDKYVAEFARLHRGGLHRVCALKIEFLLDLETNLSKSVSLYEAALDVATEDAKVEQLVSLTRRVGNVRNELGVYYMNYAVGLIDSGDCPSAHEQEMLKRSYSCFERGIQAFKAIDDEPNTALLLSNTGRLMRLCAQAVTGTASGIKGMGRGEFSAEERIYFNRAFESYQKALRCLGERKSCREVWDTVTWELSGAYYTMATLLQDYAPLTTHAHEEVEKEVTELMMKALKLCERIGGLGSKGVCSVPGPHSTEQLDQRLGSIHHRLASLYHNSYRNQVGDQTKKQAKSLAELHYSKTCNYFKPEKYPCQSIRIQLERVAMCEYHVTAHGGSTAAIKTLQMALDFILATDTALQTLSRGKPQENGETRGLHTEEWTAGLGQIETPELSDFESQELKSLLPILETRLYSVLKDLVKMHSQKKGKARLQPDHIQSLELAKRMYSVALRASTNNDTESESILKCRHLADTLQSLKKTREEIIHT